MSRFTSLDSVESQSGALPEDRCVVKLSYDPTGRVEVEEVSGCHPIFAEAARAAVGRWRYWPEVDDGVVQGPSELTVAVVFRRE